MGYCKINNPEELHAPSPVKFYGGILWNRDAQVEFIHEAIHCYSLYIICWLHPQANFQHSKL